MTNEVAKLLTENYGEIREDYSGRYMYGKETIAVIYEDPSQFQECLVNAAFALGMDEDINNKAYDILEELYKLRTDNMGLGIVVY